MVITMTGFIIFCKNTIKFLKTWMSYFYACFKEFSEIY